MAGNQFNSWGFPQVPYSGLGLCRTKPFIIKPHRTLTEPRTLSELRRTLSELRRTLSEVRKQILLCHILLYYLNCLFRFLQFKIFTIFFMEQHCAHTTVNMRVFKSYHNSGTRLGTVTESYSHLFPFFDRKQITFVKKYFFLR